MFSSFHKRTVEPQTAPPTFYDLAIVLSGCKSEFTNDTTFAVTSTDGHIADDITQFKRFTIPQWPLVFD